MGDRYTMWRDLSPRVYIEGSHRGERERDRERGKGVQRLPLQKKNDREREREMKRSGLPWQEGGDWEWAEPVL